MADHKWETVGKHSGTKKHPTKKNGTKPQCSQSHLFPKDPLENDKTLYEFLIPKEKKPKSAAEAAPTGPGHKSSAPRPKKDGKKLVNKQKVEAAVSQLTGEQFEEIYRRSESLFKENPLMSLKELTGQLNSKLDESLMPDPIHANKPLDYPLSLLPSDVKAVFSKSIQGCSAELLQVFVIQLIQSVLNDLSKGMSIYGYQMIAQMVAKHRPELLNVNAAKALELIIANKNQPSRCLAIMWIFSQAGLHDFRSGLRVWLAVMLQVLGIKSLAPYAIANLGNILQLAGKNIEKGYGQVELRHYFLILDGVFMVNGNLQSNLQKTLKEYYPVLKELAFGRDPAKGAQRFFPSFLTRLDANSREDLRREVLDNLVICLSLDPNCFTVWRQIYAKYHAHSSLLLNHMVEKWSSKTCELNRAELSDTITAFQLSNETQSKNPAVIACIQACDSLNALITQSAARRSLGTVMSVVTLFLLLPAALIAADVYLSNGYTGSKIEKLLKKTGAEVYLVAYYNQTIAYIKMFASYVEKNFPGWIDRVVLYTGPAAAFCWNTIARGMDAANLVLAPCREWINVNVPLFIDWMLMHPIWTQMYNHLSTTWTQVEPYASRLRIASIEMYTLVQNSLSQWI